MSTLPSWARQHLAALRAMIVLTVVLGALYTLVVTGIAQVATNHRANGSLAKADGKTVGSTLLAQSFADAKGRPLKQWFQPRPSTYYAGTSGSGATNLGPENPDLIAAIKKAKQSVAAFDSVPGHPISADQVPADAVTSSGSGFDPDISVDYARQQVYRVAAARNLSADQVRRLVDTHIDTPALGVFGARVVNVMNLNLALARLG